MGQGQIFHILVPPKVAKLGLAFEMVYVYRSYFSMITNPHWQLSQSCHLFFKPSMRRKIRGESLFVHIKTYLGGTMSCLL